LSTFAGPDFQWIEETTPERLAERGGGALSRPLVVKGAVRAWPAWENWSFEQLAERCRAGGKDRVWRFQEGLVEQGSTQPLPKLPVAPYLEELARAAGQPLSPGAGLLSESRRKTLVPGERFHLDWAYMKSFETNRRYLADWPILDEIPELRRDFAIRTLWPGLRWTWEYVFIGPARTLTGLHQDIHHNWFCQVRGSKELLLFPPDQTPHMCVSRKFNLGSVLSEINIARLDDQPREAAEFEKTHGLYARVEAGDALFIPKHTWHAVVALEPSVSLGIIGLTALEIATAGAWEEIKNILHLLRLYRWRNCICHEAAR